MCSVPLRQAQKERDKTGFILTPRNHSHTHISQVWELGQHINSGTLRVIFLWLPDSRARRVIKRPQPYSNLQLGQTDAHTHTHCSPLFNTSSSACVWWKHTFQGKFRQSRSPHVDYLQMNHVPI